MSRFYCLFILLLPGINLCSQNQPPLIANLQVNADWQTGTLTIQYDVTDPENDPLEMSIGLSDNQGKTYALTSLVTASGDIGYPVTPGAGKTATVNINGLASLLDATFRLRLVADDLHPVDIVALVAAVDSNRMRDDLSFVEGIRHHGTGPAHLMAVRDSMVQLFENQQLSPGQQYFPSGGFTGWNIWGTNTGTAGSDTTVIIDAHYDAVFNAPGADDNGSGVVGVMEASRILSRYPSRRNLRFIGFDLEEAGLLGSKRYVLNGLASGEKIAGVFNFEMIGYYSKAPNSQALPTGFDLLFPAAYNAVVANNYRGDFITNVGNVNSGALADLYEAAAAQFVPDLKVLTLKAPGNSEFAPDLRRSDHAAFWDGGHKALMLSDGANFRNECYHTPQDTLDNKLNMTFMSRVTQATIAAAAQLAGLQNGDWETADFSGLTGSGQLTLCKMKAYLPAGQRNNLYVQAEGTCSPDYKTLKVYDANGAMVLEQTLDLEQKAVQTVMLSRDLTPGLYFMHFLGRSQQFTQKLIVY